MKQQCFKINSIKNARTLLKNLIPKTMMLFLELLVFVPYKHKLPNLDGFWGDDREQDDDTENSPINIVKRLFPLQFSLNN